MCVVILILHNYSRDEASSTLLLLLLGYNKHRPDRR